MCGKALSQLEAHFSEARSIAYLSVLIVKEVVSRNWGLNLSLPTGLGISCSLIISLHISKFSILLGVVLIRNENFC